MFIRHRLFYPKGEIPNWIHYIAAVIALAWICGTVIYTVALFQPR